MRPSHLLAVLRIAALIALATSAALYVDYTMHSPSFCPPGSGCAAVRTSGYGYIPLASSALPIPLVGVVGFGGLIALSLLPKGTLSRRLLPTAAAIGGLSGLGLIVLQGLEIGQFCLLCMVVDTSALLAAVLGIAWFFALRKHPDQREPLHPGAWAGLALLAVAAPLVWPRVRPELPVPPGVHAHYVPGKINVVEFADFECPFCRILHGRLKVLLRDYPGKVNFVRLNMPLERHPHAHDAARAALCAEKQGRGDDMADRLFQADDLNVGALRRIAVELGLDANTFDQCVVDPQTDQAIFAQAKILRDAGFEGLPTTYVGAERIVGAQSEEKFRDAFERSLRGEGARGIPASAYFGLVGVAGIVLIGVGRQSARRLSERSSRSARRRSGE